MSVCLKSKNSVKSEVWSNVFTNFNTNTKSCLFMKQLTHSCISTILYLRKILPDNYFEPKNLEGMTLKLLKSGRGLNYAERIQKWLDGAFEAIEKQYLKHLMLDIQDADSKMTLEIYTMTFNYHKGNDSLNLLISTDSNKDGSREFTVENTKLTTIKLLQMCYAVTQTYASLPSQITLAMRLSYHKSTPVEYQPSGYVAWEPINPIFPKMTRSVEIGLTGTQHHLFKLVNKSCFNDKFFEDMENISQNSGSVFSMNQTIDAVHMNYSYEKKETKVKRELTFDNSNSNTHPALQQTRGKHNETPTDHQLKTISNRRRTGKHPALQENFKKNFGSGNETVRCACMSSQKSEEMFPCLVCKCLVHAECFGILVLDLSRKIRFYCHLCNKPETDSKCYDKVMVNLKNPSDQQKLAVLRRVLKFCCTPHITKITLKKMEKIAGPNCLKDVVEIVLQKMIEIGVAIPQGKKKNFLIDKHELEKNLAIYFYRLQNSSQSQSQSQVLSYSNENVDLLKRKSTAKNEDFVENKKCKKSTVFEGHLRVRKSHY